MMMSTVIFFVFIIIIIKGKRMKIVRICGTNTQRYKISDTTIHVRQPFFEEPQVAGTLL